MNNVLLISYLFPPSGTVGVGRALAYVRYLRQHGCHVSVLTAHRPQTPGYDPELCELVPDDVAVHRAWNPELPFTLRDRVWKRLASRHRERTEKRRDTYSIAPGCDYNLRSWAKAQLRCLAQRILFPDPQGTWVPWALRKATTVVTFADIDTVILNVPPFSTLRIGVALKHRFPGLKIIIDFRDEWLGYYLQRIDEPSPHKVRLAEKLEGEAVRTSSCVSTVTQEWVRRLRGRYPDEPSDKFICTPNGYEPDMFSDFKSRNRADSKMLVTYFGSVHMNGVYSPKNYLNAMERLPGEIRTRINTRFIGRVRPDAETCLQQSRVAVEQLGFMPKRQGLRYLEETDFLLLIATDPTSHAGKLFDYLATGKPILALTPPNGEIAKLLRETGAGWCADPYDLEAILAMLLKAFERLQTKEQLIQPKWDVIRTYSWPSIFKDFVFSLRIQERREDERRDLVKTENSKPTWAMM
jgi:hypothetical protein